MTLLDSLTDMVARIWVPLTIAALWVAAWTWRQRQERRVRRDYDHSRGEADPQP